MSTYISEQKDWKEKWKNFKLDEFKCKCGCAAVKVNTEILDLLQDARDILGSLSITSAYRCSSHNSSVSSTGANGPHFQADTPFPIILEGYLLKSYQ